MVAQIIQQGCRRAVGDDLDGIIVHSLHSEDAPIIQIDFRAGLGIGDGSRHILSGQFAAVVELDALLQVEEPLGIADILISIHQAGFRVQIGIGAEECAVSQLVHIVSGHRVVVIGSQGGGLAHGGHHQAILTGVGRSSLVCASILLAASGQQRQTHGKHRHKADQMFLSFVHCLHLLLSLFFSCKFCRIVNILHFAFLLYFPFSHFAIVFFIFW